MKTSERNKLIPMVEFVNRINELVPKEIDEFFDSWILKKLRAIENCAKFFVRPLTLGMLVPCSCHGIPLKEPERWNDYLKAPLSFDGNVEHGEMIEYEEAKERVMFEDFEVLSSDKIGVTVECGILQLDFNFKRKAFHRYSTVEDLANEKFVTLTPNALKEIYGS